MIKVLSIIQLPRECGGSYTTGIARVGEGLFTRQIDDIEMYWYFTNVKNQVAKSFDNGDGYYYGYIINPFSMFLRVLLHPAVTIKQWKHYKSINSVNPLRFEFYKDNFVRVLKKVRPDLIHMHSDGVAPLFFAKMTFNVPILLTFHGIMYEPETGVWEQNKKDLLANIKMADYYTALNNEVKRKALSLGVDEKKLWIVPNGTNSKNFYYSKGKREIIRAKYNVKESTLVFITVGAVFDRKGQLDFLMWLEQQGIDYQYWIAGKGPDEERIEEYITFHSIQDRVRLLGYTDSRDLYAYHSAADFYAHVSTTEGQAMSEIEAYATGLPTIVRDMIKNTVIGDPEDKSHYYVINLNDPDNQEDEGFKEWSEEVRKQDRRSLSGCDWSEVAQKYGVCYKEIMKIHRRNDS